MKNTSRRCSFKPDIILIGLLTHFYRQAFQVWHKNPNITILGNHKARRLPIFSMLIYHQESGKFLHHNFVSVLLNDLYGIQARGGCACAGPYAQVTEIHAPVSSSYLVTCVPYCASLNEWSSRVPLVDQYVRRVTRFAMDCMDKGKEDWEWKGDCMEKYVIVREQPGPLTERKRGLLTYITNSI